MRITVYGAGAVGGYFGGRLAATGYDVTFLARGAQLAALQANGLTLHSVDGDWSGPVSAVSALADAPPPDLVLLAVKARDVASAATDLAAHLTDTARVMALQNGIGHIQVLQDALGPERVIAATAFIGARVASPGVVRHSAAGFMRVGRWPEGSDPVISDLVQFLTNHGIKATESSAIRDDMWKKLIWNCGFNGPSALTGKAIGPMLATPASVILIRGLMAETAAVGRARGARLSDNIAQKTFGQTEGLADFKTSMLQDVEAGRPIENDAFYGFVCREGKLASVATPLSQQVFDELARRFPTP
ncbi:MAG: ketopantoate reductase family protein [Leptospirillia bacterium]